MFKVTVCVAGCGDTPDERRQINALLVELLELSPEAQPLSEVALFLLLKGSYLFLARDEREHIIGMATLVPYHKPAGYVGVVEDVVVTKAWREKGVGKALMQRVILHACSLGLESLDLTSMPSRTEAWGLYLGLGFKQRETGCFRLVFAD